MDLDAEHHKLVDGLDRMLAHGIPSLIGCRRLKVRGPVVFEEGVILRGEAIFENTAFTPMVIKPGTYGNV